MDWSWAIGGVSEKIPRTAGIECSNFLTKRYRISESLIIVILCTLIMYANIRRLAPIFLPSPSELQKPHPPGRLILLIIMTLTFGIEMGFKLATRSVIYTLHPCHLQSILQIYLLAARPSKITTALFRVQMTYMNGPFLAFIFPEVDGRVLPLQQATYWIQHALLFIIPAYLLKTRAYTMENFNDFKWVTIGVAFMFIYHFGFLTALSMQISINLNHMLCPSPSDPFEGQFYRLAAVLHETMLCPILYKLTVMTFHGQQSGKSQVRIVNTPQIDIYDVLDDYAVHQRHDMNGFESHEHHRPHREVIEGQYATQYTMPTTKID